MLSLALPLFAAAFSDWPSAYQDLSEGLLEALQPDGRS
jgi:hypothetical protein